MSGKVREIHGVPLKENIDLAVFEYINHEGFVVDTFKMYYTKHSDFIYVLEMGNHWHEFDMDGKCIRSVEIKSGNETI